MKVKIFKQTTKTWSGKVDPPLAEFEHQINKWISDSKVKISKITQSQGREQWAQVLTISVWYER